MRQGAAQRVENLNKGPMAMTAVVLPARAVYLVAEGSRAGFVTAVQLATGRWGGMTEPIVPVTADGTVSSEHAQMVAAAGLEAAINVDVATEAAERASELLELALVPLDQAGSMATCSPSAVRANPAIQMPGAFGVVNLPAQIVHGQVDGPLWQITALGCPLEGAPAISRPTLGGDDVWRTQLGGGALLELTLAQFGEYHRLLPGQARPILWITEPDSLPDCLEFWNVRALRPVGTLELPMLLFTDEVVHWLESAGQLRYFLTHSASQNSLNVAFMTRSVQPDQVDETARALDLVKQSDTPGPDIQTDATPSEPVLGYRTDLEPSEWVSQERSYGVLGDFDVHLVPGGDTAMRIPSPVVFRESGSALLRISGPPLDGLPQRQAVASLMGPPGTWREHSIQFSVPAAPVWSFELSIPTLQAATYALIDAVTTQHTPSQPGRLAAALRGRADLRLLLDAGVYECADTLATPRSKDLRKELEEAVAAQDAQQVELLEIASRWGGRAERRFQPARQIPLPQDVALIALEKLCLMGWAERGLQAPCDVCGITSFHPTSQVSHQPACPACQEPVTYTFEAGNLCVVYRLNGVVDRAADHGVLPHLLVIAALTRDEPLSFFLPGTDLKFEDEETPEVDIFGVWGGKVLAGEVKTTSVNFTDDQLERDVKLSRRLGADVHLLAALDTVPESTVRQARALCRHEGLELVVYDKARLRPAASAPTPPDTGKDAIERVQTALGLLIEGLERDPIRAAAKAGLVLKTAMEPRQPSAGQVEALKSLVRRYGADLVGPLQIAQQELSQLVTDADETLGPA